MNILIINSPDHATDQISHQYQLIGLPCDKVQSTHEAIDRLSTQNYEAIIIPLPSNERDVTQPIISNIKRACHNDAYIITLTLGSNDLSFGANLTINADSITPDFAQQTVQKINNIKSLKNSIGNNTLDFPSAGGIIARSAFNQLFLSSLDRSNRYSEVSSIIEFSIDNYQQLYEYGGNYIADYAVAALSKKLVQIRRQTDIIGQIKNNCFSLLLQMPKNENEVIMAATRFSETLAQDQDIKAASPTPVNIKITLTELPTGQRDFEQIVTPSA